MLGAVSAVDLTMFSGPLRVLSIVFSLVILLSFGAFAVDEARNGSDASTNAIASGDTKPTTSGTPAGYAKPTPAEEKAREAADGTVREALDDADDILMAPFASVSDGSSSSWVRRGFPALLGLLVYGFGLAYLSRFAAGRA